MPWIIGIDEAGYGPNLGPLVMTAVGCQVPEALGTPNLWRHLQAAVRRHDDRNDGRIIVADSKLVYSSSRGLAELERAVTAVLPWRSATLHDLIEVLVPDTVATLRTECWYAGVSTLPVQAGHEECATAGTRFKEICNLQKVRFSFFHSVVVAATDFNALVERHGSKGAVLAVALVELLRRFCRADTTGQHLSFYIDKHGGRNHYAAVLQPAFDDALVLARVEGAGRSVYEVIGQERSIAVTFEPRADNNHFCVALASMVSKYLRELFMLEFNQFWQRKIPGLKPTAGYPGDAGRFWKEIAAVVRQLGIHKDTLWRCR
jgi:hypothetical protein